MDVESERPLAASGTELKEATPRNRRRTIRNIIIGVGLILLLIILLIVILTLTVFKPKDPQIALNSVALDSMSVSLDIPRFRALVNISVDVDVAVKNPNKVGFKYTNTTSYLNYRGQLVGEAPIPAGQISSDASKPINLTLAVMADRLLSNSTTYTDVLNGILPFNIKAVISGKVQIINIFKIHVQASSSCDFTIFIGNSSVSEPQCKYKTKL